MITFNTGCAQIGAPTGGPRDSLAPVLVKAVPEEEKLNFTGNKITLTFNEYIDLRELQNNLLVSPVQKSNPVINFNLKTVTIKFRDTLLPNTTYSVNFGNALRDNNEGNILKNFAYTFSTGPTIDSLELNGKVQLAETGKIDSTLLVMIYRDAPDSAVQNRKPDYITRLSGDGSFRFYHLPGGDFKIYALKDGDGGKTYNSPSEIFAFNDTTVNPAEPAAPVILYAYAAEKKKDNTAPAPKQAAEKKLRYGVNLSQGYQDLLLPFEIGFNNSLKKIDSLQMVLRDTNYNPIPNTSLTIDSTRKTISIRTKWQPEAGYIFILPKEAIEDSSGNLLSKSDTLRFFTKAETDYGRVLLRFKNLDVTKNPVIQFIKGESVIAYPITSAEWSNKMFAPGEYEIRILYDSNGNGIWDPGNYLKKLQPEKAISLPNKIGVRADWDNERDISL